MKISNKKLEFQQIEQTGMGDGGLDSFIVTDGVSKSYGIEYNENIKHLIEFTLSL